ncbi:aspartyl/asparaginyl beta-hydroxylase domain-containing protein [Methylobacterium indicum]|nr:aspartyl/asparaginyl beta-hydroxylase domain-containing protein [Methylobacterium indicum]
MTIPPIIRGIWKNMALYNFSMIFNPFFDLFIGGQRRPAFFDIDKTFPALRLIDQHYTEIRTELEAILPRQDLMPRYHELDTDLIYASGRFNRDKRWNVFMLYCYGAKPERNRTLCPRTVAVLDRIPNLSQAFFSILDPGKSIPAHSGPTRTYIRYHLGLKVPENKPPQIRVKDTLYTWKEGESVLFDDSWNHEILNESDGLRAVLIVDVLRPLPFPAHQFNLLLQGLGRIFYGPRVLKAADKFHL